MFAYNTIEEALEELKKGKIILVTDDSDRENEGDFICAGLIRHNKHTVVGSPCWYYHILNHITRDNHQFSDGLPVLGCYKVIVP